MSEWHQPELDFTEASVTALELPDNPEKFPNNPEATRYEYPESLTNQQRNVRLRHATQAALRQESAQMELGGYLPEKEPLDDILLATTEKHLDLVEMFEHLNVVDLVIKNGYENMTVDDKKIYDLHFERLMQRIMVLSRGMRTQGNYLNDAYKKYEFKNDKEMFDYALLLKRFIQKVYSTDAYQKIMKVHLQYTSEGHYQKAVRDMSSADDFYVIYDSEDKKFRTEEVILKKRSKKVA